MKNQSGSLALLLITYAGFALFGISESLLGVAWPAMRAEVGAPLDSLGLLIAVSMGGLLITSLLSGPAIARIGVGRWLFGALLVRAAAMLGYALIPVFPAAIGVAFLAGLAVGAIATGSNTYIAQHHSAGRMSWLHASFGIGSTIGPLFMAAMLQRGPGWRWGYAVAAALALLVALGFLLTLRRWPVAAPPAPGPAQTRTAGPAPLETMRFPLAWLGVLLFLLYRGVEVTAGQWTFSWLTEARAIDAASAGLALSIFWAALTVGRILSGLVADRIGEANMVRAGLLGAVLGVLVLMLARSALLSTLGLALMGLSMAPVFPLLSAATPRRVGQAHTPNAVGFQIAGGAVGAAVLPALAGSLGARIGLEIVGPLLLGTSIILFVLHELSIRRMRRAGQAVPQHP